MLDIEDAKLPPPKPDARASSWNVHNGVSALFNAKPAPMAGNINNAVVKNIVLRPPAIRMKKVLGILRVAPLRPAMAVRVKSSAWVKGKPRLSIWTVMIPQYNQTANPHSRLGMDIQRFLRAIALPVRPEVLAAGDFDGDDFWDVVVADEVRPALYLLAGNGTGGFAPAVRVELPGPVTALATGEINRADGLPDLAGGYE